MSYSNICPFQTSKYYKKAFADPLQIVQPIGFKFLSKQQVYKPTLKKGNLQIKILSDKPIVKVLSQKRTLNSRLVQFLKVSQASRKNSYISTSSLGILSKANSDIVQDMTTKFIPLMKNDYKKYLQFLCAFHSLSLDSIFTIKDYSLSKYLIYYDGNNLSAIDHIFQIMETQFIEYSIHIIQTIERKQQKSNSFIKRPQIGNLAQVDQYIQKINQFGNKQDKLYHGVQLFIADSVAKQTTYDIQKQEIQNLQTLQFHIYVLTGILADGQNAIIKLRGTLRHKTTDILFLYKLAFNKISLIKPLGANLLQQERYLICQGYCQDNGKDIHTFLKENYNLLQQFQEQRLLVNPQNMFKEDFQTHVMSFNDNIISKGLKQVIDQYLKNTNIQFFPPKQALIEKLKQCNLNDLQKITQQINHCFPQDKKQQEESKPQQVQNNVDQKPQMSIFDLLKAKKEAPVRQKSPIKHQKTKLQEAEQIQRKMQQKYKMLEKKKEEQEKEVTKI